MISEFWLCISFGVCLVAGYMSGRVRPLWSARDWAVWHMDGQGPQTRALSVLAVLLLPDQWLTIWRVRNRAVSRMYVVPAPRRADPHG